MSAKFLASEASTFLGISQQAVHKRLRSNNLPFDKSGNRVYFGHETAKKLFGLDFSKLVIAVQIVKGGTGKTSLAHNTAVRANLYGAKVLCIDIDQQANLTDAFGLENHKDPCIFDLIKKNERSAESAIVNISPGLDLIPSRIENTMLDGHLMLAGLPLDRVYSELFRPLLNDYDLIIIDCPPALSPSVTAAALASDFVLAPVCPERFATEGLRITANELATIGKKFGRELTLRVIMNKFNNRTILSTDVLSDLFQDEHYQSKMFKTVVRSSQEFPNSASKHESVFETLRPTAAKEDVDIFTQELLCIGAYAKIKMTEEAAS